MGDSSMLKNLLVVSTGCEEIPCEEIDCKVENIQDVHMALTCGETFVKDGPLYCVKSSPPNMLVKGKLQLSFLCGWQPSFCGVYLLADRAYASHKNMKLCKDGN